MLKKVPFYSFLMNMNRTTTPDVATTIQNIQPFPGTANGISRFHNFTSSNFQYTFFRIKTL